MLIAEIDGRLPKERIGRRLARLQSMVAVLKALLHLR